MITEIRLRRFRCFDALDFLPGPARTCILGQNAQGKTSILEAVCVLLRLQSPRTSSPSDLVKSGHTDCSLDGRVHDTHLQYRLADGTREILLDSKPQTKSDDYLSVARICWFANSDLDLVKGGGSSRRRFLDFLGTQSVPGYRKSLRDYERALRSRNALLKEGRPRREIAAFDAPLIESGEFLLAARRTLVETLAPLATAACAEISASADSLSLAYNPGATAPFAETLAASRPEEDRLRQTVRGPHRDDLEISLNSLKASAFASEGQQRGIALALKIAQARHLAALHPIPPILLLDDIFGELDPARRNRLLAALPSNAQTLITTTFLDWADHDSIDTVLHLQSATLSRRD
ncbi:MAG: DNA replication/repair protein RecF [Verrucomicrobiota bacterium]